MKLEGRVALVTGAGRGIGAATARKLATEGARVVAAELDEAALESTVRSVRKIGGEITGLTGDVTSEDFADLAVRTALDQYDDLDIVVNNAGYIWNTTIQKTTDEQWNAMLDVHVTAQFRILRRAFEHFKRAAQTEARQGRTRHRKVVNVSSVSGTRGSATQVAYSAGKAAVIGLTKTLAQEWGRYSVNVNAIAFGLIETRLTQATPEGGTTIRVKGRDHGVGFPEALRDRITAGIPLGRPGTPEEGAGAIFLFCTPESDYISGQVIEVTGGQ